MIDTIDDYLKAQITHFERGVLVPKGEWWGLSLKVRLVDGRLEVAEVELSRDGKGTFTSTGRTF